MKQLRAAIYVRKSTEKGLDQAFNSLNAQREAASAYIMSQRSEGWVEVEKTYEDGGISGGTLERPGLLQLLADVDVDHVDIIVVYKVDRLTRSLTDFAQIIKRLDTAGASFVSVTQQFNTSNSMGRLTLNVLLSFAQFEREVTAERIRDKIDASRRKGMWMGGVVPLGYKLKDKKLQIEEGEAQTVKLLFTEYSKLGTVSALIAYLKSQDIKTRKGTPFTSQGVYHLLKNPIYMGKARHKGTLYDGEHEAIIDPMLFHTVQEKIRDQQTNRRYGHNHAYPDLLTGLVYADDNIRLIPSHSCKQGYRHRYYISKTDPGVKAIRYSAIPVETQIKQMLAAEYEEDPGITHTLKHGTAQEQKQLAIKLIEMVLLNKQNTIIQLKASDNNHPITLTGPAIPQNIIQRRKLKRAPNTGTLSPNTALMDLLAKAHPNRLARAKKTAGVRLSIKTKSLTMG